jgi:hypothetical protein
VEVLRSPLSVPVLAESEGFGVEAEERAVGFGVETLESSMCCEDGRTGSTLGDAALM